MKRKIENNDKISK
uniref:Uncharacterized protein n=1 Tax=Anguilla anguilla TaxID=7936 RepID=A0A0E9VBV9_ANGAN